MTSKPAPQLEYRLLTPFITKKVPPIPKDDTERKRYPRKHSFIISRIMFWWLMPIMNVGYKRTLDPMDLYYLDDDMTIQTTFDQFQRILKEMLKKHRAKLLAKNPSISKEELNKYPKNALLFAIFKTFKWEYLGAIFFKVISDVGMVLLPLLTKALINYVQRHTIDPSIGYSKGIAYSFGVLLVTSFNGICINHFLHRSITTGAHSKSILTTALLKKSFIADSKTKRTYTPGKVTSLMSTDLARIDMAIGFMPFAISFPVPVIIAIALLVHNIGVSSLVGIAVFVISITIISSSIKKLMIMRRGANQYTDGRISLMREILQNMKIIKFYSWEDAYENNVIEQRTKEVDIVFKMQAVRSSLMAFGISLPAFTSMISFLVLYAIRNKQNPGDIFSSLSLFGVLSNQVLMLPMALATSADAMIGLGRVSEYLQSGDDEPVTYGDEIVDDKDQIEDNDVSLDPDVVIDVQNATFEWDNFDGDDTESATGEKDVTSTNERLDNTQSESWNKETTDGESTACEKVTFKGFHDISLQIKKNEFIIITGSIGSGKSSLLAALSGIMNQKGGKLKHRTQPLLCSQPPWVQNASVKENILFGKEFEEEWYQRVIDCCSLSDDLKNFPGGDEIEIGERGITLSGGQKARISLARAIYSNADIMLFDDVLSAVDARVGKHIVEECFTKVLKNKTRVLATHQLSLIGKADRVLFLVGDGNISIGTMEELLNTNDEFVKLMEFSKNPAEEEIKQQENKEEEEEEELKREREQQQQQQQLTKIMTAKEGTQIMSGVLIKEEERSKNQISWSVYKTYLKEGQGILGFFATPLALMLLILDVFSSIFTNTWLSFWISNKFKGRSDRFYIGIYVMFTLLSVIFISAEFVIMSYMTLTAAKKLNLKAMKRVLHTPMSFMDITPMGRILNRFSKDTESLDNETGEQIRMFLHPTAYVIGILILCSCYFPYFAVVIPIVLVVIVCYTSYYQAGSREIKRIEAVQRSFVYNNFNEVLNGMLTIKVYNSKSRFLEKNFKLLNKMNEAYFIVIANQRWISVHLDLTACLLALIISLLCIYRVFDIDAASVGLVLTNVLQLAGLMSLILRAYTNVENEMNSVERLCHYANDLEQEAAYHVPEKQPPSTWPEHGQLEFQHVSLRYRDGLPLVLNDLNISIKPNEKIGICGRTGAGKSTIMSALYRLSELAAGKIFIDGVDISEIGMFELRSKLSIIPQDPVLFQGTIRSNLDPFDESSDSKLWDALRRSGLIESLSSAHQTEDGSEMHKFHLAQTVEDEGSNFSLGERQLLALARALVRNSKILILDEATSSVDYETDAKIQQTIINEFNHCTILCIAHRLKTILNYDRILVLDYGQMKEFDTPLNLFHHNGIFRQMCDKSGIVLADIER